MTDPITQELAYRWKTWEQLLAEGGPIEVFPKALRALGIYGGAQGIWVDKKRTAPLTPDGSGVTVGVLHTGTAYADDLSADGVLYHYPRTQRPRARDLAEIQATKAAGKLGLLVFVITYSSALSMRRDVHLGWVEGWDDDAQLFLIGFGETQPPPLRQGFEEEQPFVLVDKQAPARREMAARPGQQRFKFLVLQRYGVRCAVCDLRVLEVLDAAHLRPKQAQGSDDPRNGLVLCAVHHRAFDAGLFAIEPQTLRIHCRPSGPDTWALRLQYRSLEHLPRR
ncbi:MAG TPA: HNH endonuclease, partial [Gammaproteobacteria bacterium]|nr:HNH endonuclease [Gammaproteobacteria bacterium]